jgi:hypothetical protein
MSQDICHDFKTPRTDSSRRLPPIFAMIPVVFYLSLAAGLYFNITSFLSYSTATKDRDTFKQIQAEQVQLKNDFETEKLGLYKEKLRAERLAQWIEGTRSFQPVTVAISRCLPPEITLGQLSMERSQELPSQINLTIFINNGTVDEVGKIQAGLNSLNYRPYNTQQTKNGETLEYRSMLVWQQL